jgi:valyl-tRNA synthetase
MPTAAEDAPLEARWIVAELHATAAKVNQSLENYRYDDAANTIYQFFWGSFCDWYLEIVKLRLDFPMDGPGGESASEQASKRESRRAALTTLVSVFEASLRLLSPFMPFLTEEIWHALYDGKPPAKSIALTEFPRANPAMIGTPATDQMLALQFLITGIRARRKILGVPEKQTTPVKILIWAGSHGGYETALRNAEIISKLAQVSSFEWVEFAHRDSSGKYSNLSWYSVGPTDVVVDYEKTIDIPAERDRLTKEIAKFEKGLAAAERQLGNEGFLAKAPAHVVEGLKKQEAETRLLLEKAHAALVSLPAESGNERKAN